VEEGIKGRGEKKWRGGEVEEGKGGEVKEGKWRREKGRGKRRGEEGVDEWRGWDPSTQSKDVERNCKVSPIPYEVQYISVPRL
jgi:hypothetical protein